MKQHGDLGGVEGASDLVPDPPKSSEVEAGKALDNLKDEAQDDKRDAKGALDQMKQADDM